MPAARPWNISVGTSGRLIWLTCYPDEQIQPCSPITPCEILPEKFACQIKCFRRRPLVLYTICRASNNRTEFNPSKGRSVSMKMFLIDISEIVWNIYSTLFLQMKYGNAFIPGDTVIRKTNKMFLVWMQPCIKTPRELNKQRALKLALSI